MRDLRHIAIIMDGNGRWATGKRMPRSFGHQKGAENLLHIAEILNERGLEYLTVYAFSTENWQRPEAEVNYLTKELPFYIHNRFRDILKKRNMKLLLSGRRSELPPETLNLLEGLERDSAENSGLSFVFAYNYGGQAEIVDAVKRIVLVGEEVSSDSIARHLYNPDVPPVDLLIRTGGEQRISNFLLWQSAYAELYFTPIYWPDFDEDALDKALEHYYSRQRRYGGIIDEA